MASGAIVGECPVCGDWIFEDEWTLDKGDIMVHQDCKGKRRKYGLTLEQEIGAAVLASLRRRGYAITKVQDSNE